MVGREDQLALLERHLVEAADGRGQVVAVTAAAGLGKSRLLVEAARLLTERGFRVYEGEAQAFGTRSSYGAWHGIWAAALDVGIDDPADQQRRQVAARVAALDPTLSGRVPLLGAALGLAIPDNDLTASLSPKLRKASLEALLVSLVTRLTEDGADGPAARGRAVAGPAVGRPAARRSPPQPRSCPC